MSAINDILVALNPGWARKAANASATKKYLQSYSGGNVDYQQPRNEELTTAYRFRAHRATATGDQTVTSGAAAVLGCDAEDFDPGNNYDNTTFIYTVPVTGYYLFSYGFLWSITAAAAGSQFWSGLILTSGEVRGQQHTVEIISTEVVGQSSMGLQFMTAGDTAKIETVQNSGANQAILGNTAFTWFSGHLVSI